LLLPSSSRRRVEGLRRLKVTFENVEVIMEMFLIHPGKLWLGWERG